jgi:hypothetical protein
MVAVYDEGGTVTIDMAYQVADRIDLLRAEREDIRPDEFTDLLDDFTTATELLELYDEAHRIQQALKHLKDAVALRTGEVLDGEAIEWGDYWVTYRPERRRKLINRDGFIEWLGPDDFTRVVSMPLSGGKVTALRHICDERGVDYGTIMNTFFVSELGAPKLHFIPQEVIE